MPTRLMFTLLCVICAGALSADFVGTVKLTVTGTDGKPLEGVKVAAEADPLWGRASQEEFEKYNKDYGPFPKVEASGEFTTDQTGDVRLNVTVKLSGEGRLPQQTVRQGNQWIKSDYVMVKLTLSKDGYRTYRPSTTVTEVGSDDDNKWRMALRRISSFKAQLVHKADRKPVANAKVLVDGKRDFSGIRSAADLQEVMTDAQGMLTLNDEQCPVQYMKLRMLEDDLAFAPDCVAWNNMQLRDGANDGGTLEVVPGGAIRVHPVHADTGADVSVDCYVFSADPNSKFTAPLGYVAGEFTVKGVPAGSHKLNMTPVHDSKLWPVAIEPVIVEAGKVAELGKVKIEPHHTIEVFAVSDQGAGVQQYQVEAMHLSGFKPARYPSHGGNPEQWTVTASCSPEQNKVQPLARGRWRVTVTALGFSPGSVEIDVPAAEPIFVKLEQGGQLQASLDTNVFGWGRLRALIAISANAPALKELNGRSGTEVLEMIRTVDSTGVFVKDDRHFMAVNGFDALPPGTYTVFGYIDDQQSLRADNVEIKKGEVTQLVLTNSSAKLTARVANQGKPLAQEMMYLVPARGWNGGEAPRTLNGKTDAQGVVVFNDVPAGNCELLTSRQYDWINSGSNGRAGSSRSLPRGVAIQVKVGYGDRVEVEVDTHQSRYVWVSVKLKAAKGATISDVKLVNLHDHMGLLGISPVASGNLYQFGLLPKRSAYELSAAVTADGRRECRFLRLLEITQLLEQQFEFDVALGKLEVKVKAPKGFKNEEVTVYLEQPHDMAWASWERPGFGGSADAKGSITFANVPEGPYRVVAWAAKSRDSFVYVTSEIIELKGTKKVSLKFDERVGELHIKFEDFNFAQEKSVRIELMDGDTPAVMGRPTTLYRQASNVTLSAVAKGTYTLRITAIGFEPYIQQNVEIDTLRTTSLNVTLKKMCSVSVQLEGANADGLEDSTTDIQFLDAAGAAIALGEIDVRRTFEVVNWNERSVMRFQHVPANCATIRVVAEGYKNLEIEVKPQPDKQYETKATLVRE